MSSLSHSVPTAYLPSRTRAATKKQTVWLQDKYGEEVGKRLDLQRRYLKFERKKKALTEAIEEDAKDTIP